MPTISVIVPVYKAEAFLRKCTDSILHQTFTDLELILVEDGSPDGSGALCDAIAAEDSRVRAFHQANDGVSSARNLGLREARGTYIAFADSDDWMEPTMLETLYQSLVSAGADSAGCAHLGVTPDGHSWTEAAVLPAGVYDRAAILEGIVYPLTGDRIGARVVNGFIWRYLYSASVIREAGITFDGAYLEDELLLLEYFCHAKRLAMTDKPLYNYLQNPSSVTHKYMKDYLDTFFRFLEKKEALVERYGLAAHRPHWREESCFAGLLIAIGNEYATGNPASWRERQARVKAMTKQPDMARALLVLHPRNQSRNKQIVTELVRRGHFGLLTALYRLKNRG